MKRLVILILMLAVYPAELLFAQKDSSLKLERIYEYDVNSFSVNSLGELYLINSSNQLKKIDTKGDSAGVFNQVTKYGKLSYVESQNPWKTILFYQNFSTIVLLDKFLNVLTNINLRKHGIFRVKAVSTSYDNNIWVYDETENKLKKIDDGGRLMLETVDLRSLFSEVPSPVQVLDADGFVYLYDPEKGIYIFDRYGTYKNKLRFLNWKHLSADGKFIYGFDDKYFYRYAIGSLTLDHYPLPSVFNEYSAVKAGNGKIYLLKDKKLMVYGIKKD